MRAERERYTLTGMFVVRYEQAGGDRYGLLDRPYDADDAVVTELAGDIFTRSAPTETRHPLAGLRLLAPVMPSKIVAVGRNYHAHAKEMGGEAPAEPLLFLKPPTAVIGPEDAIQYPVASTQVDYEAELAVVIKTRTSRVTPDEAKAAILGYTCFNDVTARDLQRKDRQWTRAKSFDTFAPLGPCLVTDLDPGRLMVEAYVNGERRQSASTSLMVFNVYELVSFISHVMTLLPGDVIATGTPEGVGPLQRGDVIEVVIEGIGRLRNRVV